MIIVEIRVVPSSGTNKWALDKAGRLKCFLKSAPERGLANKELIRLIAQAVHLPLVDIEIVSGATSRTKRVKINSLLSLAQVLEKLGILVQQKIF